MTGGVPHVDATRKRRGDQPIEARHCVRHFSHFWMGVKLAHFWMGVKLAQTVEIKAIEDGMAGLGQDSSCVFYLILVDFGSHKTDGVCLTRANLTRRKNLRRHHLEPESTRHVAEVRNLSVRDDGHPRATRDGDDPRLH